MRVLCGCEASQTLCRAFRERGHEAYSCDITPPYGSDPRRDWHIQADVMDVLARGESWDLVVLFPPCVYLSCVGNRWMTARKPDGSLKFPDRGAKRDAAVAFVKRLWDAACGVSSCVVLENPRGVLSTRWRPPTQYVSPHLFGSRMKKTTGLWLKCLPMLNATRPTVPDTIQTADGRRVNRWHFDTRAMSSVEATRVRSRLDAHLAAAMADQWGSYLNPTPAAAPARSAPAEVPPAEEDGEAAARRAPTHTCNGTVLVITTTTRVTVGCPCKTQRAPEG